MALRSALHRRGYRFRKDHGIRGQGRLIKPDIVFTKRRVAIFVDGCFWHSCPEHGRVPRTDTRYWLPKLHANTERDKAQVAALETDGWFVMRFWEHEEPDEIADLIALVIP